MSILVFAEQRDGAVRGAVKEALGEAVRLSASLGGPVNCVLAAAADPGAAALGEAGADKVLLALHEEFRLYSPEGYLAALAAAVEATKPKAVLLVASAMGKDLAPRLAARLGVGLATDCTSLAVQDGGLVATRPVYAGKAIQKVRFTKSPALVSLRPKMFAPVPPRPGRAAAVERPGFAFDPGARRARVVEVLAAAAAKLDLTEADIIVSGGRALKGPENFALLEDLASALGGVVGASRAVVDAGWRPHSDQVGQTGKTVAPKLYVAIGISGAIQHLAGMSSSRCIVAINKDPDAPIFKVADYGLVGDLFEVVPALTAAVKQLDAGRG
jgi:electron transfer flavoprotein alpha subunit